ncbi:unnamed protein product [Polarella glacialis]|uniref:Uncharacterized protein n=1 Tax=Polarella glacialis TaxID=89957 RepID=A0A813GEK7_POLGL|nr:unnamed protein product [Polarella glacialis]
MYHRRCAFSSSAIKREAAMHCNTSAPLPTLCRSQGQMLSSPLPGQQVPKGWMPLPRLSTAPQWAKFVASGRCSSVVHTWRVASALAAALPLHAGQLSRQLATRFGIVAPSSEHCSDDVQQLSLLEKQSLEAVATWAFRHQFELTDNAWGVPALSLLQSSNPESWAAWFSAWDAGREGMMTRGTLALALGSAVRAAADRFGFGYLPDVLASVVPLICCSGDGFIGDKVAVSLNFFLTEVAPVVSHLLKHLPIFQAGLKTRLEVESSTSLTRPSSPGLETPVPESIDNSSLVRVTFVGLCGGRRIALLPGDLLLSGLDAATRLLAADSLGFELIETTGATSSGLAPRFFFAGRAATGSETLKEAGLRGDGAIVVIVPGHDRHDKEKLGVEAGVSRSLGGLWLSTTADGKSLVGRQLTPFWVGGLLLLSALTAVAR